MAYANFTAAWNAWSSMYTGYFNEMGWTSDAIILIPTATTWTQLRSFVWSACNHLRLLANAHAQCPSSSVFDSSHYAAVWYAAQGGIPPSITMDDILNAMLSSSFDNLQQFIGIVDAYRVALWNAPFNADFYAALARGFQQWP